MKKILAILLISVLILSLCACGAKPAETKPETKPAEGGTAAPAEGGEKPVGSVFVGKGYTIAYPETVEEVTDSLGNKVLEDKAGVWSANTSLSDDYAYDETVAKFSKNLQNSEGFKSENLTIGDMEAVKLTYVDSIGSNVLYLIKLNDNAAVFLNFSAQKSATTVEQLETNADLVATASGVKAG